VIPLERRISRQIRLLFEVRTMKARLRAKIAKQQVLGPESLHLAEFSESKRLLSYSWPAKASRFHKPKSA
jgi:hypothetical protein